MPRREFLPGEHVTSNDKPKGLAAVRKMAQERMQGVCTANKVCDGAPQRICQGQKYGAGIGFGGAGKGLSFAANVEALDRIRLKTRLVSEHAEPELGAEYLGRKLAMPAMPSSLSGVRASMGGSISELEFARSVLQGAKEAGLLGWIGNTADEGEECTGIEAVASVGVGVTIFKPQSNARLVELFQLAERAGAVAVGVDLDGVGSTNWDRAGKPVYRKSVRELRELADSTELLFIAKGVMCAEDALAAIDAGADAIDVSNHGGRALDSTRGVAEVLPGIAKAVGGKVAVTAGGGVRTGFDVLKMLALGADAALVGRDVARAAIGGGATGVAMHFEYLRGDFRRAMMLTGCNSVEDIDGRVLDREP
jgi:isopentenyl diphosphate isomerase/L-lactate dehydrogenase-like FMN-dependent dehydrogenase